MKLQMFYVKHASKLVNEAVAVCTPSRAAPPLEKVNGLDSLELESSSGLVSAGGPAGVRRAGTGHRILVVHLADSGGREK